MTVRELLDPTGRSRSGGAGPWAAQARRILVMSAVGYLVFWIVILPYYWLAHEPLSWIWQGLEGGTFLDFGVLFPSLLIAAWVRDVLRRRGGR